MMNLYGKWSVFSCRLSNGTRIIQRVIYILYKRGFSLTVCNKGVSLHCRTPSLEIISKIDYHDVKYRRFSVYVFKRNLLNVPQALYLLKRFRKRATNFSKIFCYIFNQRFTMLYCSFLLLHTKVRCNRFQTVLYLQNLRSNTQCSCFRNSFRLFQNAFGNIV